MNAVATTKRYSIPLLLPLLLLSSGCTSLFGDRIHPQGTQLTEAARNQQIGSLIRTHPMPDTVRSLLRATFRKESSTTSFRYVFAYQRPEYIRLDILPINSALTIQSGACSEGNAVLLYPAEKRALTGTTAEVLATFFSGLPVQPDFLLGVLTGRLPISLANNISWETYQDEIGKLTLISPDRSQTWYITEQQRVSRIEVRDATLGKIRLVVTFGPPISCGNYQFPSTITAGFPTEGASLALLQSNPQCDQAINPQVFTLPVPPDFTRVSPN